MSTLTIIQSTYAPLYTLINYLLFTLILSHLINSHYHNTFQTHISSSQYLFSLFLNHIYLYIYLGFPITHSHSICSFLPLTSILTPLWLIHLCIYTYYTSTPISNLDLLYNIGYLNFFDTILAPVLSRSP